MDLRENKREKEQERETEKAKVQTAAGQDNDKKGIADNILAAPTFFCAIDRQKNKALEAAFCDQRCQIMKHF